MDFGKPLSAVEPLERLLHHCCKATSTFLRGIQPMHEWKEPIEIALQVVTIIVLVVTWWAIRRQAVASEKLIQATQQQIETGREQANAAREQVEVARRQITESLRPILICQIGHLYKTGNGDTMDIDVENSGAGTALYAWWSYGKFGDSHMVLQRHRIQSGIIPATREARFRVDPVRAKNEGIVLAYKSLSGIDSASTLKWEANGWVPDYIPDVSDWAKTLIGRLVGPA